MLPFDETRSAERLEVLRAAVKGLKARADEADDLQAELDALHEEIASGLDAHEWCSKQIKARLEPLQAERDRFRSERNRLSDLILSYASPGRTENLDPTERYHEACEIVSEFASVWSSLEGIIREAMPPETPSARHQR